MKKLAKVLKQKSLLAVLAFAVLICLILVAGSRFGLPLNTRLLIILIVVFLGIFFLLMRQLRANKESALIEKSIKSQADDQSVSLRPGKREEIEELRRELLTAIESLKRSKLGKGRSGRAALYALPWYMVIGPPAAGKTTAILNSGLEFPYGSDIKGIGGTRNCDWFFSNSAIILDTAGRYIAEDEDRDEWLSFLDILKKYRRKRPINGVIVGMSITDILKEDREGLEWHAKNIRRRVDELIQRLGVCFPVYLVFTKCDLVQGFVESFEGLNRKEREQVWGSTFGRNQPPGAHARDLFEAEWNQLLQALGDLRLKQLSGSPKPENRGKIYAFPLQLDSLKDNLVFFVGQLFKPNPYQESPLFRGFYLTSGTQEGVPIDRVIQAIARQFDLPAELVGETEVQKKTYFIKDLFMQVVIPDQNVAFHTSKAASHRSRLRFLTVVSSLVFLAAFIFGTSQGFVRSRVQLNAVKSASQEMKDMSWGQPSAVVSSLKSLDRARGELIKLDQQAARSRLNRFGMDRGGSVLGPARRLYLSKAGPLIKTHFYQEISDRLRKSRWDPGTSRDRLYDDLKAYMLLGSEVERLEGAEIDFLQKELLSLLDEKYPFILPQDGAEEYKPLAQRQIAFFIECLSRDRPAAFENDATLIAAVRNLIYKELNAADIYERVKRTAAGELPQSLTASQIVSPQDREWIWSEHEVPGLFTKMGWESRVEELIKREVENPDKADWVLGQSPGELASDLQDSKRLAEELRRLYFKEYAETWWQFLRGIQYEPFADLDAAARILKRFTSRLDSPLALLLERVADQTEFEIEVPEGVATKVARTAAKKGRRVTSLLGPGREKEMPPQGIVNRDFQRVHELMWGEGESPPEFLAILGTFAAIGEILDTMKSDPGPRSLEYAGKILSEGRGELPEALMAIRRQLDETAFDREARRSVFEQPLENCWAAILQEAQLQLNALWRERVHRVFETGLGKSFPFEPRGGDASIPEFKRFFQPDGVLWKFVDEELGPVLQKDTWDPKVWEGRGIRISQDFWGLLDRASTYRRELFSTQDFRTRFQLQPDDPPYRWISGSGRVVDQIVITIDGETEPYRMGGRYWKNFEWPGQGSPPGAALSAFPKAGASMSKRFDGEWGWLRLLAAARIEEVRSRVYRLSWLIGEEHGDPVDLKYLLQIDAPLELFQKFRPYFSLRVPEAID
jgi:type VI secretion system protein ImpL